jgi:hypothetical protein
LNKSFSPQFSVNLVCKFAYMFQTKIENSPVKAACFIQQKVARVYTDGFVWSSRSVGWLLCLYFYSAGYGVAQNLVPNSGFEDYRYLPAAEAQIQAVSTWFNPNQAAKPLIKAIPDYIHQDGEGPASPSEGFFTSLLPYEGQGMTGLVAYHREWPDFREYLSVPLTVPLEPGVTYQASFWVAMGSYGYLAVSGLGLGFSIELPTQHNNQPLTPALMLQHEAVVSAKKWEKLVFTFTADQAYRYVTIGNFADDQKVEVTVLNEGKHPCAYYLIDEVVLEAGALPTVDLEPAVLEKDTLSQNLPDPSLFEGRKVTLLQTIVVRKPLVDLRIMDAKEPDGDIISLNLNGEWVLENHEVKSKPFKLKIGLKPQQPNYLVLFAVNLGYKPPNTASLIFKDGGKKREITLRSDLQTCGTIVFIHEPK